MRALALLLALAAATGFAAELAPEPWALPQSASAAQPGLVEDARGGLLLSWVERQTEGHALRYARFGGDAWSPAATALSGPDWFVNWADTPGMLAFADGGLAAFSLVKNGPGTYAYDVRLAFANANGNWGDTFAVHEDGTQTEHGFVSLWREGADALGIAWLDGRNTSGGGHDGHAHGSQHGAMSFRAAVLGRDGDKRAEHELDARTCDCCTTASAAVGGERWLAYRGRDEDEIRDIRIARRDANGRWLAPVTAHADRWYMPACPVNGPSLAASEAGTYLAWFTAADRPRVRLARLDATGRAEGVPLELAEADALGRVALAADADTVWLAWLTEDRRAARLWLACFDPALHERGRSLVAELPRGRGGGLPRLALRKGIAHLVATDVENGKPQLRGWTAACPAPAGTPPPA
jgi:hypothetical protein